MNWISEDPASDPNPRGQGRSWPEIILNRPNVRRPPTPQGPPTAPFPDATIRKQPPIDPGPRNGREATDDSIKGMLDQLYLKADTYLNELAHRSGGQLHRADTLVMLPQAFAAIAAELSSNTC